RRGGGPRPGVCRGPAPGRHSGERPWRRDRRPRRFLSKGLDLRRRRSRGPDRGHPRRPRARPDDQVWGPGRTPEAPSAAIGSRSRRRRKVRAHGRLSARDLVDELARDGVAETPEIVDWHDERPGPADDVVAVILREASGRIGVKGEIAAHRGGAAVEDREPVDDRAGLRRRVARRRDGTPLIARAVSGHVDDPEVGRKPGPGELAESEVDRRADRGPPNEGARRSGEGGGEDARVAGVADDRPADHELLFVRARPFDVASAMAPWGPAEIASTNFRLWIASA